MEFTKMIGINTYNFFITPTIRVENRCMDYVDITMEWLKFYIGIRIIKK